MNGQQTNRQSGEMNKIDVCRSVTLLFVCTLIAGFFWGPLFIVLGAFGVMVTTFIRWQLEEPERRNKK